MNWQHFRAFLWLRWRLRINQIKRAGVLNAVLLAILAVGALVLAVSLFFIFFAVGLFAFNEVPPHQVPLVLMFVWDGLVAAFLFSWLIGLVIELQRSEALSLQKFMHLPVSLTSAFLINYFSSLMSLTLVVFVPGMIGLCLGLAISRGPGELLVLPVVAAFVLMITALTYQLQGWLASLMANPRRRRTVIVMVTIGFILITQLPNLFINVLRPSKEEQVKHTTGQISKRFQELEQLRQANKITAAEYERQHKILLDEKNQQSQQDQEALQQIEQAFRIVNLVFPPGWLALGAEGVAAGNFLPPVLCFMGLTLVGAGSLWRSYRTAVRLSRGEFSGGRKRPAAVAAVPQGPARPPRFLEAKLPWLSERAAAIALGTFRGLVRAPEAKMMLLTPILLVVIFGGMFLSKTWEIPEALRPLAAFGAVAMILLTMVQFVGNQFGFDRNGFRVFVLCGVPRRDILLGKNLAVAPLALGMGLLVVALMQVLSPMRIDHLLAVVPQAITMFLLFCLVANAMSILAPLPIPTGAFKPASIKGVPLLLQFAFLFVFPTVMAPTLLPLALEYILQGLGVPAAIPTCLLLSLAGCVATVFLYALVLHWEGVWLQAREQRIVEVVTTKAE